MAELGIIVAERIRQRHPDISDEDVRTAWSHPVRSGRRNGTDPTRYIAVGFDRSGRALEMCAVLSRSGGAWYVFHAQEAQASMLHELGFQ